MRIKKIAVCVAAVIFLMGFTVITAKASSIESSKKLTPAFDVISAEQRSVKTGLAFENVRFTLTDFKQYLGVGSIEYITIQKTPDPSTGFLAVGSMVVTGGQVIMGDMLSMLEFVPASSDVEIATFSFSGDNATSGADVTCTLRLIEGVNYAPSVAYVSEKRHSISAVSGHSVSGTLLATDPEGDDVYFEIVSYPEHGYISSIDPESGRYVYSAFDGYTGNDRFVYVAVDEYGNYTNATSVSIDVISSSGVDIKDISKLDDTSAVSYLVGREIMETSIRGGERFFYPDIKVTRVEFIVIAMRSAGRSPSKSYGVLDGIADVTELSAEQRGYICSAIEGGYLSAETNSSGERVLRPNDIITKAEAAKILSRLCGYEKKADEISVFADSYSIDAGTARCISAMYEYGIIDLDTSAGRINPSEQIDRGACAVMIYRYLTLP